MSTDKTPGIVVGDGEPRRLSARLAGLISRHKKSISLILVLVLVLATAAYLYPRKENERAQTPPAKLNTDGANVRGPSSPLKPIDVAYVQLSDQELSSKISFLMGTKQYAEAEKLIQTQNDLATNKIKLSLLLAVQTAQKKTSEASQTADKINALGNLRPGEYETLGRQYENAGDKQKAVEYYKKAIAAFNKDKQGTYQTDVDRIEAKLKELQ